MASLCGNQLFCLLHSLQKLSITERLQEVVNGIEPESFKGILLISRCEDHLRTPGNYPCQLGASQVRHLDVKEHQVNIARLNEGHCLNRVVESPGQFQRGSLFNIAFHKLQCKRLIVYGNNPCHLPAVSASDCQFNCKGRFLPVNSQVVAAGIEQRKPLAYVVKSYA